MKIEGSAFHDLPAGQEGTHPLSQTLIESNCTPLPLSIVVGRRALFQDILQSFSGIDKI